MPTPDQVTSTDVVNDRSAFAATEHFGVPRPLGVREGTVAWHFGTQRSRPCRPMVGVLDQAPGADLPAALGGFRFGSCSSGEGAEAVVVRRVWSTRRRRAISP